jgi:hypothetical protein
VKNKNDIPLFENSEIPLFLLEQGSAEFLPK